MKWQAFGVVFCVFFFGIVFTAGFLWMLTRLTDFLDRYSMWVSVVAVAAGVALLFAVMAGVNG